MRIEVEVYKELKNWFNSYGIQCWINQGDEQFHVRGGKGKPDLVIYSLKIKQYIAIEVKKGDVSKDIYDAGLGVTLGL